MKIIRAISLLFLCTGLFVSVLEGYASEAETCNEWNYYSQFVSRNPTGVFENDGKVYVHVRIPRKVAKDTARKARVMALPEVNRQLCNWGVAQRLGARRQKILTESPGVLLVNDLLARFEPNWMFHEWRLTVAGREFPVECDDRDFLVGFSFDKDKLIASIPQSFSKPPTQEELLHVLPEVLPRILSSERRELFLRQAGVLDMVADAIEDEDVCGLSEYQDLGNRLDRYLDDSPLMKEMKVRAESIRGPHIKTSWRMDELQRNTDHSVNKVSHTNLCSSALATTNEVIRLQSDDEQTTWGSSAFDEVSERVVDFEEGVVEVVITRMTVERVRYALHRIETQVEGRPSFEDMMLQNSLDKVSATPSTDLGKVAIKTFGAKGSLESKENSIRAALRKNPGDWVLWNLYGRCFQSQKEHIAAVICFRAALKLNPEYEFAWTNLATTYADLGYKRLALGAAVMAKGFATDNWCVSRAEEILCARN